MNAFTIKKLSIDDRPREKLLQKGVSSLSNAELLAIILGSGSQNENAVELAKRILAQAGNNLSQLGKFSLADLKKFKGVGTVKAINVIAATELGRRRNNREMFEKRQITTSNDAYELFHPMLGDLPHEESWALFLNRRNQKIDMQRVSSGGVSGTIVDIRLILKMAIDRLTSGIILCHNHPSGSKQPSSEDTLLTHRLREASHLLDIKLMDHLIIANNEYYSFADEGTLSNNF